MSGSCEDDNTRQLLDDIDILDKVKHDYKNSAVAARTRPENDEENDVDNGGGDKCVLVRKKCKTHMCDTKSIRYQRRIGSGVKRRRSMVMFTGRQQNTSVLSEDEGGM